LGKFDSFIFAFAKGIYRNGSKYYDKSIKNEELNLLNEGDYYLLSGNVRLRRESFGGIAFDTKTGLTMELDREAFSLLWMARQGIPVNAPVLHGNHETARAGVASIMKQFLQRGVIQRQVKRDEMIPVCDDQASGLDASGPRPVWTETGRLVAPETIHWAVTYRCRSDCPDCYTARFPGEFRMEMTTAAAFQMLDTLAAWGVFQLAMGGGEPLIREDLPQLAARARENGMVVHVTTGLERIAPPLLRRLAGEVRSLHFGLRDERLLGSPRTEISRLSDLLKATADLGLFCGVNLILSNTVIRNFTTICELIAQTGISRLILLRYKPPAEIGRWIKQNPTPQTLRRFESVLAQTVRNFPELDIRVDCGLSFLQRILTPNQASAAGIKGCAAAERILALTPDGSIFPCSQLIHSECRIGNILTDPVRELWARSPRLRSYRHFREKGGFEETACGICKANISAAVAGYLPTIFGARIPVVPARFIRSRPGLEKQGENWI
jgi:radical SAM protein with 4Fe4S-binding SPASM domain